jgi:hypothetical protein
MPGLSIVRTAAEFAASAMLDFKNPLFPLREIESSAKKATKMRNASFENREVSFFIAYLLEKKVLIAT